jgi:hypothetical protein
MKKIYSMTFDPELMNKVDAVRGLVPRSTFIGNILEQHLGVKQEVQ